MDHVQILLIEDDPGDVRLTKEALRDSDLAYTLDVVRDGIEALQFLRRLGNYARAAKPNIILLDLNLPRKDGYQVLEEIKSDPKLKHIPVIVLSTSKSEDDIRASYRLQANSYVTKPDDFYAYMDAIKTIEKFWFDIASLPERGAS